MDTPSGWIKLHRKMLQWQWWGDVVTSRVFLYLLLAADYDGTLKTNLSDISKESRIYLNGVRKAVNNLVSTGEIEVVRKNANDKVQTFVIKNWSAYQATSALPKKEGNDDSALPKKEGSSPPYEQELNTRKILSPPVSPPVAVDVRKKSPYPLDWQKFADELWTIYPRRENYQSSMLAVMDAIEESGDFPAFSRAVRAAVEKYRDAVARWPAAERKYIPLMSTFFRNKKYMDDPETWRSGGRTGIGSYQGEYRMTGRIVTKEELEKTGEDCGTF